jgi:hypothetical protein
MSRDGAWRGRVAQAFRVRESTCCTLLVFEEDT